MSETEAATAWEAYAAYQHGNLIHRNSLEGQSCPSVVRKECLLPFLTVISL